jgi:predicted helicase
VRHRGTRVQPQIRQPVEQRIWLKGVAAEDECRILANARCLSEGVDVPALDAVLFLNPALRNSECVDECV